MKNTLLSALFVLLVLPVAASLRAQDATPNFTGQWNLDASKSDFGPMPPPESIVHVIEHKEPSVKVVTTQKGAQGEATTERQLTTDGKENVNKMRIGPRRAGRQVDDQVERQSADDGIQARYARERHRRQ